MRRPRVLLLVVTLLVLGAAAPARASFRSVLALGQGENTSASDLGLYELNGQVPPSFLNQFSQYSGVTANPALSASDLDRYWKNSGFRSPTQDANSTETPQAGVTIVRDATFGVPRVYGASRSNVMWGAGYVTAESRLFLMDVLRHMAEARMTALLGSSGVPLDAEQIRHQDFSPAELQGQLDTVPQALGAEGIRARQDFYDYVAGINAFIAQARADSSKMPAEYAALGTTLQDWTPPDSVATAILLISQFTSNGGSEEIATRLHQAFIARLGPQAGEAAYRDLRQANDPESPVVAKRPFASDQSGPINPSINAVPDPGSVSTRNPVTAGPGAAARAASANALPAWARTLATQGLQLPHSESNAVLVDAAHSASKHPLAAMGPQVGYYAPEIFQEYELHGGGIDVSGVAFPGAAPYPLIGHGSNFAWSGTTPNGDTVDTYAEQLCDPGGGPASLNSTGYQYRGSCTPFVTRDQTMTTPVAPTSPRAPQTVTIRAQRSVHGSVFAYATVKGAPVALVDDHATAFHEVPSAVAFMRLAENQPTDGPSFINAMSAFNGMENWFYAGPHDIAWLTSGLLPVHASGTDKDVPISGTGVGDWQGFDPATHNFSSLPLARHPQAVNPADGYLVSWNNREAQDWRAPPSSWQFGSVHRSQLLEHPLKADLARGPITLTQLAQVAINSSTADLRGVADYPWMRQVIGPSSGDPELDRVLAALDAWTASGAHRRDTRATGSYDDSQAVAAMDRWWPRVVVGEFQPVLGPDLMDELNRLIFPSPDRPVATGFDNGWESTVQKDLRDLLAPRPRAGARCRTVLRVVRRGRRRVRRRVRVCPSAHRRVRRTHRPARHRARARSVVGRAHRPRHRRQARHKRAVTRPSVLGPYSRIYCGGGSVATCRAMLIATLRAAVDAGKAQLGADPAAWKVPTTCPVATPPSCDQDTATAVGAINTPPFPFENRGTFHQLAEIGG